MSTEHEDTLPPDPPPYEERASEGFGFEAPPEAAAHRRAMTEARALLLDPNRGSDVKVIRPVFALPSVTVTLGDKKSFHIEGYALSGTLRVSKLKTNAPMPGELYMTGLSVANVLLSVGVPWAHKTDRERELRGMLDEPSTEKRHANAQRCHDLQEDMARHGDPCIILGISPEKLPDRGCCTDMFGDLDVELPTLTPDTKVTLEGFYSGHVPMGYAKGSEFTFTLTFSGHGSLV
jgi:hypothetical protein